MISPKICHCIHPFFRNYGPVSTPSSYCIGYIVIKDTASSYFTKYTMCTVHLGPTKMKITYTQTIIDFLISVHMYSAYCCLCGVSVNLLCDIEYSECSHLTLCILCIVQKVKAHCEHCDLRVHSVYCTHCSCSVCIVLFTIKP